MWKLAAQAKEEKVQTEERRVEAQADERSIAVQAAVFRLEAADRREANKLRLDERNLQAEMEDKQLL